jgi:hypothetical protein
MIRMSSPNIGIDDEQLRRSRVIGLRALKIAPGGAAGETKTRRMFAEKWTQG